jgi:chromosome segregation ATPase
LFTRTHRVGKSVYTEVLESYRDPETGRPKHHCIVRWRGEHSLAEEIAGVRSAIEGRTRSLAERQAEFERTKRGRNYGRFRSAQKWLESTRRDLDRATAHHAALETARAAGLEADDDAIRQATEELEAEDARFQAHMRAIMRPPPSPLAELAARLRDLMAQNDHDVLREGLREVADKLDALSGSGR